MAKFLRSNSFKMLMFYLLVFSCSVLLLSFFLYRGTISYITQQTDSVIEAEINGLSEQYSKRGLQELVSTIDRRISKSPASASIYLLVDRQYRRVSGNLAAWPTFEQSQGGWVSFNVIDHQQVQQPVRAKVFKLYGDYRLIVGRNISTLTQVKNLITDALIWFFALTLTLGVAGGLFISRRMLGKVTRISRSCEQIINGDLTQRIERDNSGDEFDQLSKTMNTMLDSNYQSMLDIKRVSDNIAHDLKTPLSRLKNALEQARMAQDNQTMQGQIEHSIEEADNLLGMFNALLKIVSIETNQDTPLAALDLQPLLEDVFELYQPIAESKHIDLQLQIDQGVPLILSNRDLLFQAVANVVDNAIKYTPEAGNVSLYLQNKQGQTAVVIQDSGIGVPDAELPQITQRFYRTDQSRQLPGTGLGLSLVSAICQALSVDLHFTHGQPGLKVYFGFPHTQES